MPDREQLLQIIREVRSRWRWKVVLRSVTVLVGAAILALIAVAYSLEQFRFSPASILAARVVLYLVLVILGWFLFVRPLGRRVSDEQVALYLEEHEPSLQEILVSAVDVGKAERPAARTGESAELARQVVKSAVERCQASQLGRDVERTSLRRSLAALGAIAAATALVFSLGPAYLRHGAMAVLVPVTRAAAASPYRVDVTPGSVTVARGADVAIAARLRGFTAAGADLFTRRNASAPFERTPMVAPRGEGPFETRIFKVRDSFEYFVQSAGVRSAVFRVEAAALPFVERMEMELVYPAYTGLPPRVVDQAGDVAVLRGTTVRLRVHPTMKTGAGRIVRDGKDAVPMTLNADGTLGASFEVKSDGFYHVDLASSLGTLVTASPQYTIDALADQPPAVKFAKPSRDLRATSVDEIYVEAAADDDYGLKRLELVYSVNGGPERRTVLAAPAGQAPRPDVAAGHTFFLEELGLKPGDVVSYYARATDNDAVSGEKSVTSDMFFLQIQPFRKDYRAAESQAGGMQGGQQGNDPSALSEQQRRIVSATFNSVRDRGKAGEEKYRQDVVFLGLTQGQLRERTQEIAGQIRVRVAHEDPALVTIAGALEEAAKAMQGAEQRLQARDAKGALPSEQQALASLQRAEEAYRDVRVRMQQNAGGGGGQQSAASQELADLFQLEVDKLRNQYETVQRSQQQSADAKVDEMAERLKELARRQEQEAERQRQLAGGGQAGGSASGARQRQLADETEEAARQLERLSREENRQELAQMARDLRSAADAMRRAAASGDAGAFSEAQAAADRLSRARDGLEQQRGDRLSREIDAALSRTRRLADEQKAIENGVRGLDTAGAGRQEQAKQLQQRKAAQAGEVADLAKQLDRAAADARRQQPDASRKVQAAADGIRDDRLKEKIDYSRGVVQAGQAGAAAGLEQQIADDIASLESRLREAAGAARSGSSSANRPDAMARAQALARGVGSMQQRLRDQQQAQADGQQPRAGQRGGQGQQQGEGAQARGGQQGQQGQGGQQAQGQQAQSGAQGQQAQGGQARGGGQQGGQQPGGGQGDAASDSRDARSIGGGGAGVPRGSEQGFDPRQFQREARERRNEAQALRGDLRRLGVDVTELDSVIRALGALDSPRVYNDPEQVARLQQRLAETLQRFETALRRDLAAAQAEQLLLPNSGAAPEAYRKQIEEYYRSLARERKK